MTICHVGPSPAPRGGPAGYLRQLQRAAATGDSRGHQVLFPPAAAAPPTRVARASWMRRGVSRLKRRLLGAPAFTRPTDAMLGGGHVDLMIEDARRGVLAETAAGLRLAREAGADVLVAHEAIVAEQLLAERAAGQQVWLMVHSPMPLALFLVWSWGVPERDWRELVDIPDVKKWIGWELELWRRVDRVLLPCREALDEICRIAPGAKSLSSRVTYVLTGGAVDRSERPADRAEARRRWRLPNGEPVGLFLGNAQPYRGLDRLLEGAGSLDRTDPAGVVAIAGPDVERIPRHARVRALGPVGDVAALLHAVDFVINVNRFCLFDLSTIEALDAARPLLLHAVGGNRTFRDLGAGCVTLPDLETRTLADGLRYMFAMPADERARLSAASRRCYEAHLTPPMFWRRHLDLYDGVTSGTGQSFALRAR